MSKPKIKVDIVSDVVCPWCYIGKRRIERAINTLNSKYDLGIEVLGPDINESGLYFTVKDNRIRFGLSALKGVGEGPVDDILNERKANGLYTSIFNITSRLNLRTVNKKSIEALVLGGALDSLNPDVDRAAYFVPTDRHDSYIEHALRTGSAWQDMKNRNTMSLLSVEEESATIPEIPFPKHQPWSLVERLNKEKEVTGIYISAHPLDEFRYIIENFTTCSLSNVGLIKDQPLKLAGIVAKAEHKISKKGTGYGFFVLEDYGGSFEFPLFSEDYMDCNLARAVAQSYYDSRERLGFPMAPREWVAQIEKKTA